MNTSILLDTNAYTGFKTNREEIVRELQTARVIGMSPIVLAELYAGFRLGTREKKNLDELETFRRNPRVQVLQITERTAFFYAHIFAALKQKARPIPSNDIWIAASAMEHGLVLVSFDSHFQQVDGLACRLF